MERPPFLLQEAIEVFEEIPSATHKEGGKLRVQSRAKADASALASLLVVA